MPSKETVKQELRIIAGALFNFFSKAATNSAAGPGTGLQFAA